METSYNSTSTKPLYKGVQVTWYFLGVIETLLAFRFILKLLGANAGAGFTDFIYSLSYVFVTPFRAVFQASQVTTGSVFEWSTLLAMLVYLLIASGLVKLLVMSKSVSTPEAAARLDQEENN